MAVITSMSLSGATITYNGVRFGGVDQVGDLDSAYGSLPPTFRIRGDFRYDESRRAVTGVKYILSSSQVFRASTAIDMASNAKEVMRKLSAHGKELKIEGLGSHFLSVAGVTSTTPLAAAVTQDVDWGPHPLFYDWHPISSIAYEVLWVVEFTVIPCSPSGSLSPLALMAFNFDTTWQNDFEGLCQRTISGYAEVRALRSPDNARIPEVTADAVRDSIIIIVPVGFERTRNVWRENPAGTRVDFVVVDEALPGDILPPDIVAGDGELTFDSTGFGTEGASGFEQGFVTMSMNLRTSPKVAREVGAFIFLSACISKQNAMQEALNDTKGSVIPLRLSLRQGKFRSARNFSGSMSWMVTKCLNEMIKASGLWEPIAPNDYTAWRTTVEPLWGNRGLHGLRSVPEEHAVIDLCSNRTQVTIGETPSEVEVLNQVEPFSFTCPTIPEEGGWLGHDIELKVLRRDRQTWHPKAAPYTTNTPGMGTPPNVSPTSETEPDVEYHGIPEVYILMRFKLLRFIDDKTKVLEKLPIPELLTYAGFATHFVDELIEPPKWAFDVLVCPAWYRRGWRLYRIKGIAEITGVVGNEGSCAAPYIESESENR